MYSTFRFEKPGTKVPGLPGWGLFTTGRDAVATRDFFSPAVLPALLNLEKKIADIADALVAMVVRPSYDKRVAALELLKGSVRKLTALVEANQITPYEAFRQVLELLREFAAIGEEIQLERVEPPMP
jgi:hypothetical protein